MLVESQIIHLAESSFTTKDKSNHAVDKDDSLVMNLVDLFGNDKQPKQSTKLATPVGIDIDYIESSQNLEGNYTNYVYSVLRGVASIRALNFAPFIGERSHLLPDHIQKKTLILDLDETLIHADFDGIFPNPDQVISFSWGKEEISCGIFIRPGLFEFLQAANENFEIFIFTASKKEYADAVLNYIDPEGRFFKGRFYRESCISVNGRIFIKDLRIFRNRKQEDIIILDNSLYSFSNQISNGILINSFYNDKNDKELYNVINYLLNYLKHSSDVREINEKIFNFASIVEEIGRCQMVCD